MDKTDHDQSYKEENKYDQTKTEDRFVIRAANVATTAVTVSPSFLPPLWTWLKGLVYAFVSCHILPFYLLTSQSNESALPTTEERLPVAGKAVASRYDGRN